MTDPDATPTGPGQRRLAPARVAPALPERPADDAILGGRYRLDEVLGTGGTAVVYRATDLEAGGSVAVKVLRPELAHDPDLLRRFSNEVRVLAALDDPGLVRVLEAGRDGPYSWLAMEHLPGGTLASRLERGPMPTDEAVAVLDALLGALSAAHRAGIVHRDLKPQNVLLDAGGRPRLVDFGIARFGDLSRTLTATGTALGTVAWMAPEQVEDARSVDARADVYAAGALLYALLTGKRPFALYQEPADGPRFAELPARLRPVVVRATRLSVDERWPTADAMREALHAAPEPTRDRRSFLAAIAVVAGLALVAGALGYVGARATADHPVPADVVAAPAAEEPAPVASDAPAPADAPDPVDVAPADAPPIAASALAPEPVAARPAPPAPATPRPAPPAPVAPADAAPAEGPVGWLLVNAIPPAEVRVDGVSVGRTRARTAVPVGAHRIELLRDGEAPVVRAVQVGEAEEVRLCWDFAADAPCARR